MELIRISGWPLVSTWITFQHPNSKKPFSFLTLYAYDSKNNDPQRLIVMHMIGSVSSSSSYNSSKNFSKPLHHPKYRPPLLYISSLYLQTSIIAFHIFRLRTLFKVTITCFSSLSLHEINLNAIWQHI